MNSGSSRTERILSAHQATYLPWLGYYHRIAISDLHVVLDHVQFEKNSFVNRNKINTGNGPVWLTVPVLTKARFGNLALRDLSIDESQPWRKKHWRSLEQSYGKTPYFSIHRAFFKSLYEREWNKFLDLACAMNNYVLEALGVRTKILLSSQFGLERKKDEMLVDLCRVCDADIYISGALGRDYLRPSLFPGTRIVFQDYAHPRYEQHGHDRFEPNMCILDLLFNHGPRSLEILMSGNASRNDVVERNNG